MDDLLLFGNTNTKLHILKDTMVKIFNKGTFELHKWHSNQPELEKEVGLNESAEQSYAKQQLGADCGDTKLLGLFWDKISDIISINFPE